MKILVIAALLVLAVAEMGATGVGKSYNPFGFVYARQYESQLGVQTKIDCPAGCFDTSIYVNVDNADSYLEYSLDFSTNAATTVQVKMAGVYDIGEGVHLNFHLDSLDSPSIANDVFLTNTGGMTTWVTISAALTTIPKGVHNVFITFTTDTTLTTDLINISGFEFFE